MPIVSGRDARQIRRPIRRASRRDTRRVRAMRRAGGDTERGGRRGGVGGDSNATRRRGRRRPARRRATRKTVEIRRRRRRRGPSSTVRALGHPPAARTRAPWNAPRHLARAHARVSRPARRGVDVVGVAAHGRVRASGDAGFRRRGFHLRGGRRVGRGAPRGGRASACQLAGDVGGDVGGGGGDWGMSRARSSRGGGAARWRRRRRRRALRATPRARVVAEYEEAALGLVADAQRARFTPAQTVTVDAIARHPLARRLCGRLAAAGVDSRRMARAAIAAAAASGWSAAHDAPLDPEETDRCAEDVLGCLLDGTPPTNAFAEAVSVLRAERGGSGTSPSLLGAMASAWSLRGAASTAAQLAPERFAVLTREDVVDKRFGARAPTEAPRDASGLFETVAVLLTHNALLAARGVVVDDHVRETRHVQRRDAHTSKESKDENGVGSRRDARRRTRRRDDASDASSPAGVVGGFPAHSEASDGAGAVSDRSGAAARANASRGGRRRRRRARNGRTRGDAKEETNTNRREERGEEANAKRQTRRTRRRGTRLCRRPPRRARMTRRRRSTRSNNHTGGRGRTRTCRTRTRDASRPGS